MVGNTNDGTQAAPRLRSDINYMNVNTLPPESSGPHGDDETLHRAVANAGYEGIQGGDPALCRELGLGMTTSARINAPGEAAPLVDECLDHGYECATLHVAWGLESDSEVDELVSDILRVSADTGFPLYIETHRSTITQDIYRTLQLVGRFPEIRFNGDFSHWYTGHELTYGDLDAKLDFMEPVFERVRFMHGRIGNSSHMQVDVGDGTGRPFVDHFREMWTRSFCGFLRSAEPGDYMSFNPELLQPSLNYARAFEGPDGVLREETDRWEQAAVLTRIARECFQAAQDRVGA
jgi:hypothetical protein